LRILPSGDSTRLPFGLARQERIRPRSKSPGRSLQPKNFTAEPAKIAKTYHVSTAGGPARRGSSASGQRLGQNVPVCAPFFLPPLLWIWGGSLRAWRPLRFKCTFWVQSGGSGAGIRACDPDPRPIGHPALAGLIIPRDYSRPRSRTIGAIPPARPAPSGSWKPSGPLTPVPGRCPWLSRRT